MADQYINGWESYEYSPGLYRPKLYEYDPSDPWSDGVFGGNYHYNSPLFCSSKVGADLEYETCIHFHNTLGVPVTIDEVTIGLCSADSGGRSFSAVNSSGSFSTHSAIKGHPLGGSMYVRVTSDAGQNWLESNEVSFTTKRIGVAAKEFAGSNHSEPSSSTGKCNVLEDTTVIGYAYYSLPLPGTLLRVTDKQDKILWVSDDYTPNLNDVGQTGSPAQGAYGANFGQTPFGDPSVGYSTGTGAMQPSYYKEFQFSGSCPTIFPEGDAFLHLKVDPSSLPSGVTLDECGIVFNLDMNTASRGNLSNASVTFSQVIVSPLRKLVEVSDGHGGTIKKWELGYRTKRLVQQGGNNVWENV